MSRHSFTDAAEAYRRRPIPVRPARRGDQLFHFGNGQVYNFGPVPIRLPWDTEDEYRKRYRQWHERQMRKLLSHIQRLNRDIYAVHDFLAGRRRTPYPAPTMLELCGRGLDFVTAPVQPIIERAWRRSLIRAVWVGPQPRS